MLPSAIETIEVGPSKYYNRDFGYWDYSSEQGRQRAASTDGPHYDGLIAGLPVTGNNAEAAPDFYFLMTLAAEDGVERAAEYAIARVTDPDGGVPGDLARNLLRQLPLEPEGPIQSHSDYLPLMDNYKILGLSAGIMRWAIKNGGDGINLLPDFLEVEAALSEHYYLSYNDAPIEEDQITTFVVTAGLSLTPSVIRAAGTNIGRFFAAERGLEALEGASSAAFKAADNVDSFTVSAKHLFGAGGRYRKFAQGANLNDLIAEALWSDRALFKPNTKAGSFIVETNLGRAIGSKGETVLNVVLGDNGKIWTAYPIK
tara:strand:+ start:1609 stop:2550 length:942 start_codon:yes stop_codon:yes gene_type:complete